MLSRSCLFAAGLVLGGCSSQPDPAPVTGHGGPCDNSSAVIDSYAAGIVKTSADGKIRVKVTDALPAPPARHSNKWTILFTDGTNKPLGGMVYVQPFMPDHGHGTTPPEVGMIDAQGAVVVDKLDFVMPGVWEVRFSDGPVPAAAKDHRAVFAFCIDG